MSNHNSGLLFNYPLVRIILVEPTGEEKRLSYLLNNLYICALQKSASIWKQNFLCPMNFSN